MKKALLLPLVASLLSVPTGASKAKSDHSVLYIGDSQSAGFLGRFVFDELTKKHESQNINVYAVGASSPRHWVDNKQGEDGKWLCSDKRRGRYNNRYNIDLRSHLCVADGREESIYSRLNEKKPDYVIFQFLGNSMGQSESDIKTNIDKLMEHLGNQKCLFITSPPFFRGPTPKEGAMLTESEKWNAERDANLRRENILRQKTEDYIIAAVGGRCKVVSGMKGDQMMKFSQDRKNYVGDKIHLSKAGAQKFLNYFAQDLP